MNEYSVWLNEEAKKEDVNRFDSIKADYFEFVEGYFIFYSYINRYDDADDRKRVTFIISSKYVLCVHLDKEGVK